VKDFLPSNTKVLDTENYTYYYKQHSCETFSYPHLALHPQASEKEKQLSGEKGGGKKKTQFNIFNKFVAGSIAPDER